MTKETAKLLMDLATEDCFEAKLYGEDFDQYSGRGMYGSTTTALVVGYGQAQFLNTAYAIAEYCEENDLNRYEVDEDEILEKLVEENDFDENRITMFRIDNLGLSYIIY